ncbi:MAG: penicillin acylase family protein [Bacillota bacterium]|nr:penicillin acylase family protein [Bacillota bacterium]
MAESRGLAGWMAAGAAGLLLAVTERWLRRVGLNRTVAGLDAEAEIARDDRGWAHVTARTDWDLFFAQGYCTAQDRLWQLDHLRRWARGRLAEVEGPASEPLDRLMRNLGLLEAAEESAELLDGEARLALEAYADGVNAALQAGIGGGWRLLGPAFPRPWSVEDSLAVERLLAWWLEGGQLYAELVELALRLEQEDGAWEEALDLADLVLRSGAGWPGTRGGAAWAVAGRRAQSGRPLLAGSLELPLRLPPLLHPIHLLSLDGRINVAGVAVPGLPGLWMGRSPSVAWFLVPAEPESGHRLRRDDPAARARAVPGEAGEAWPAVEINARLRRGLEPLRLAWRGRAPGDRVGPLLRCLRAGSAREVAEALSAAPPGRFHLVAADAAGHILYRLLDPREADGRPPAVEDPAAGWLAAAGQRVLAEQEGWEGGAPGWVRGTARYRRLAERLRARDDLGAGEMAEILAERADPLPALLWDRLAPVLRGAVQDAGEETALALLEAWIAAGAREEAEEAGPLVWHLFLREAALAMAGRPLPERLRAHWLRAAAAPAGAAAWVAGEAGRAAAPGAFHRAVAWAERRLGPEPRRWSWGALHVLRPAVAESSPAPGGRAGRGPFPVPGSETTVEAAVADPARPFHVVAGSVWSMVADLGSGGWLEGRLCGGASGHPGSAHFDDGLRDWLNGRAHRFELDPVRVAGRRGTARQILRPEPRRL